MSAWLATSLAASSVLMLVVLMLRNVVRSRFGARAAYFLWVLPLARMLTPPLPGAAMPARPTIDALPLWTGSALDVAGFGPAAPANPAMASHSPGLASLLLLCWATGAVLFLLRQLACYHRFLGVAQGGAREFTRARGISVLLSTTVPGACSTGLLRRRIFLPADLTVSFTREQVRLVLAHETAHHVRRDIWANTVALLIVAVHWFNPLAHLAYRAFRTDQELACDETVLAHESEDALHPYGLALVRAATNAPHTAACLLGSVDHVKMRLSQMARPMVPLPARMTGLGVTLALTVAGVALTASTFAAEPSPAIPALFPRAAIAPTAVSVPAPELRQPAPSPLVGRATARMQSVDAAAAPQVDREVGKILATGRETLRAACGIHSRIENIDAPGVDIGPGSGLAYRCEAPDAMRATSQRLKNDAVSRITALNLSAAEKTRTLAMIESGFTRIEQDFLPEATG
ncbi:M56 family metallopeptidase [Novosphingobium sp. TCA1]|jgi:bla regulator protein BlaR1|uniref:M56 family metallopeptidase n=2 Tax=Pseudomonadota TaxID=1224 RepID=UPI00130AE346|nr:M56 family metallopeptidase [Novosphingobium sp. TCA1]GFE77219.1 hypothetical protein NTCA1_48680 [Novosphingobium sp. TCA1]